APLQMRWSSVWRRRDSVGARADCRLRLSDRARSRKRLTKPWRLLHRAAARLRWILLANETRQNTVHSLTVKGASMTRRLPGTIAGVTVVVAFGLWAGQGR